MGQTDEWTDRWTPYHYRDPAALCKQCQQVLISTAAMADDGKARAKDF